MACAIALHNVPEGMVIGAGFVASDDLLLGTGMIMAVLIGLHNIPEGMAVSVPLISGGMGSVRAVAPPPHAACPRAGRVAGSAGWATSGRSGCHCQLGFARAAPCSTWCYGEIIPAVILIYRTSCPVLRVIVGILLGLLIIYY